MKADIKLFFNEHGEMDIQEAGWVQLKNFCYSIIYKRVGAQPYVDDLVSRAMIECVEKIPNYDVSKNNQLFGFLYFVVLGVISKEACRAKKEIPYNFVDRGDSNYV